jgi:hypothetical protein
MTHTRIPRFLRWTLTAALAFAGLGLAGSTLLASSASAAPLQPEHFSVFISSFDQQGSVFASGPVRGFGTIQTPADDLAVLDLNHPHGTVNVWHSPTPQAQVNWQSCTATVDQFGSWRFTGGTGRDWGAFGFGHFQLREFEVLQRGHHGQCEPYRQPRYFQISVDASGLAVR